MQAPSTELAPLDESLELQDPYSDLSLFLSKKMKEQMECTGGPRTWSFLVQDQFLEKITTEFQKKFPRHHLKVAPLKKVWDKVSHLSKLFEKQQDALTSEGKLNLHFLVRENLKTVLAQRKSSSFHPFLLAQQLAMKVGESLATLEGVRPVIQNLTDLIWSAEQHLLPLSSSPSLDVKDRLIIKWILDCLTEAPNLSHEELHETVQKKIGLFLSFKELKQPIPWLSLLSMEWASLLFPHTHFVHAHPMHLIQQLRLWIKGYLNNDSLNDAIHLIQDIKTAYLSNNPLKLEGAFISLDELEMMIWSCMKERLTLKNTPLLSLLLKEAKLQLIDRPGEHWKTPLAGALQFFIKAHEICSTWSKADFHHRLLLWSTQGELILRFLHFPQTPLLHLVRENHRLALDNTTSQLREQFLSSYRSPLIEPSLVHQKIDLLQKYMWYHDLSSPQESTLDRWIALHKKSVCHLEPEAQADHLISRAQKELPLLPLDKRKVFMASSL